jgi:D-alanyl-D-alanine-carboxypeptidase/D-alanyl-D-alanine-endopeptidase
MIRRIVSLLATFLLARATSAQTLDDAAIRKILVDRIDSQQQGVGIVVGLIDSQSRRIIAHGLTGKGGSAVGGDTVFEIGSTTKAFTALLLADMVERGEVSLDDPIEKYLPPNVRAPRRGEKSITLRDLATHTSALPRLPANLSPKDMSNPYADYTVGNLYEFLSKHELTRDIGSQYEYSNLGAGLLGHLLARRAGTDYETLVRQRILTPLGMKSTAIGLTTELAKRLARGHDEKLEPVANWDLPSLAGAGALRSTASDLLDFLSAHIGVKQSPLQKAIARTLSERRSTGAEGVDVALGWHVTKTKAGEIVWHNGGTGGYRSFIGFDPKRRTGVVVLSNTFTNAGVDDIGLHLLDPSSPLLAAPKARREIKLDAKVLGRYAGRYELAPGFVITVTPEEGRLFAQATGQPRAEIFAESEGRFFYKVVDAQITFEQEGNKPATALVLHQSGRDMKAKRIGDVVAPTVAKVDEASLEKLVGRYELAPAFVLDVSRHGAQLFVQATGQPRFEVFPTQGRRRSDHLHHRRGRPRNESRAPPERKRSARGKEVGRQRAEGRRQKGAFIFAARGLRSGTAGFQPAPGHAEVRDLRDG